MSSDGLFKEKAPGIMALLMQDFALDEESAAAILGNLGHESGGFRFLQEKHPLIPGSAGGWGWAQWTGARRTAFEAYVRRNDLDPASDTANYKWLYLELKGVVGSESRVIPAVKNAIGLDGKVKAFELAFERAAAQYKDYASRVEWAEKALTAYHAGGWKPLTIIDTATAAITPPSHDIMAPSPHDQFSPKLDPNTLAPLVTAALPVLLQLLATRTSGQHPDILSLLLSGGQQLPAPPAPPPPTPITVVTPKSDRPYERTGFQAGVIALLGGAAAQLFGFVAPPVGEASTAAGTLTTLLPVVQMALSGAGIWGKIAGAALPMVGAYFSNRAKTGQTK